MDEVQKVNAYCYALIKYAVEANAETMTLTQEGVTQFDKPLGDWEIVIKQVKKPQS